MTSRFILPFADVGSGIKTPSGAKLFFFESDGVTPKGTYSDQLSTPTANTNPVIADSTGLFGDIYIDGAYKVTLKDKNDSQIFGLTSIEEVSTGDFNVNLINDLSQTYDFPTVEGALGYKQSTILFPVGKRIYLADRGAYFNVISGIGTANTLDIIASTSVNQSIDLIKTKNIKVKQWGAKNGAFDNSPVMQRILDYVRTLPATPMNVFNGSSFMAATIDARDGIFQLNSSIGYTDVVASGIWLYANFIAGPVFTLKSPMLSFTHSTEPLPFHYLDFNISLFGSKRAAGLQLHRSNRCSADVIASGCKGYAAQIGDPLSPAEKGHEFTMRSFSAGFSEWNDPNRVADKASADGYQLEIYDPDGHYFNTIVFDGDKGVFNNATSNTFAGVGHIWGLFQPMFGMNTLGDNPITGMYFDDTALHLRNGGKNVVLDNCQWFNSGAATIPNFITLASDVASQKIEKIKISGVARNSNGAHTVQFFALDTTNGAFDKSVTKDLDFNISTTGLVEGYKHEVESGVTNSLAEKVADINIKTDLALNLVDEVNLISGIPVQQNAYTFIKWHIVDRPTNNEFSLAADVAWTGEFKYRATLNRQ